MAMEIRSRIGMTTCSLAGCYETFKKHIASYGYSVDGDNIFLRNLVPSYHTAQYHPITH